NPDAAAEALLQTYTLGSTISDTTTGGTFSPRCWGRNIALTSGSPVGLTLTVPNTADYDLYLYSATPDSKGNPIILASSTTAGTGAGESINYNPVASGTGYLFVKRVSGNGMWSLTSTGNTN